MVSVHNSHEVTEMDGEQRSPGEAEQNPECQGMSTSNLRCGILRLIEDLLDPLKGAGASNQLI
jgi:hypothetical protein